MVFCPSRHPLLSSRARSKSLLGAALSSVRGQSNFPANHPQFLTLLRALETCGPSSFMYGSVSSCPSGAFVVSAILSPFPLHSTPAGCRAEIRSDLYLYMKQHTKTGSRINSAWAGPKRNKVFYTSSSGEQGLLRRDSPETKTCELITWCHHPCTSVNTGSAAVAHCSVCRRNTDPWKGVPELTRCHRIWLWGECSSALFLSHLAGVASPRFTHTPPQQSSFLHITTPPRFLNKKNAECS